MSFEKPYDGLKVLDLSQGVAGPYCAMLLGRHGADVIKVEPLEGDWSRRLMPAYGDNTAYSVSANIGKQSLALDLKSDAGREIIDRLAAEADVFLEGFRPGVIERLGFDYERLAALNKDLIYVSISGFGREGPLRDKPAMDPVLQAFTGFMAENTGDGDTPIRTPVIINDMTTALYAHQAVAAALYARLGGAAGRRIDVSLMQASANLQTVRLMGGYRNGPFKPGFVPNGAFPTADGWLMLLVLKDDDFRTLCDVLDDDALTNDPRFIDAAGRLKNGDALITKLRDILITQPATHWRDKLTAAGLQNEVIQTYRNFVDHPHVAASGLISWLVQPGDDDPWAVPNIPGVPPLVNGGDDAVAPRCGQHTRAVLSNLGYSDADIDTLADGKIIGL